jgi:hypothetical protein
VTAQARRKDLDNDLKKRFILNKLSTNKCKLTVQPASLTLYLPASLSSLTQPQKANIAKNKIKNKALMIMWTTASDLFIHRQLLSIGGSLSCSLSDTFVLGCHRPTNRTLGHKFCHSKWRLHKSVCSDHLFQFHVSLFNLTLNQEHPLFVLQTLSRHRIVRYSAIDRRIKCIRRIQH